MQTMGTTPCLSAVCSFLLTISSVSAKYWRRSEWPISVCVPPTACKLAHGGLAGVGALFGKVNVLAADGHVGTLGGFNHGGQQHRRGEQGNLVAVWPATSGKKASTKALASAGVLNIFQLAAISALRGIFVKLLRVILVDGIGRG
jgi:prepilin-type processing-associated H-X9-DG protein